MLEFEGVIEDVYMTPKTTRPFIMIQVPVSNVRVHGGNALGLWRRYHLLVALSLLGSDNFGVGNPRFK